jgi:hypothetical protein
LPEFKVFIQSALPCPKISRPAKRKARARDLILTARIPADKERKAVFLDLEDMQEEGMQKGER